MFSAEQEQIQKYALGEIVNEYGDAPRTIGTIFINETTSLQFEILSREERENAYVLFCRQIGTNGSNDLYEYALKLQTPDQDPLGLYGDLRDEKKYYEALINTYIWNRHFSPYVYIGVMAITNAEEKDNKIELKGHALHMHIDQENAFMLPRDSINIILMNRLAWDDELARRLKTEKDPIKLFSQLQAVNSEIVRMQQGPLPIEETGNQSLYHFVDGIDVQWGHPMQLFDKLVWNLSYIDDFLRKNKELGIYKNEELLQLKQLFQKMEKKLLSVYSPESIYSIEQDFEYMMWLTMHFHGDLHTENIFVSENEEEDQEENPYIAFLIDCNNVIDNPQIYNINPLSDYAMLPVDTLLVNRDEKLILQTIEDYFIKRGIADNPRMMRVFWYHFLEKLWVKTWIELLYKQKDNQDPISIKQAMEPYLYFLQKYTDAFDPMTGRMQLNYSDIFSDAADLLSAA